MPAFEQERGAGGLDPPSPEVRAYEIGELPVRPLVEDHDLLAGLRQHRGIDRTGCACTDDDGIDFFELGHVTTSFRVQYAACRGCRGPHTLPWSRTPHRRRRCASPDRRTAPEDPATRRAWPGASGRQTRAARRC